MLSTALIGSSLQPLRAQEVPPLPEFAIGYVQRETDPRQIERNVYYEIPVTPLGRSVTAAEVAVIDSELIGRQIGYHFDLKVARSDDLDLLVADITQWVAEGIHFVLADLPAADLVAVSDAVAGLPVTLFNISASEDSLRGQDCRANLIHVIPSDRMITDAIVQFLVERRWQNILVLEGPRPEDKAAVAALRESANLFGARIVDVRDFIVTDDPRNPTTANVALLTAGRNYDVVFVADALGEFASTVPYRTADPRPVVGSAGLVATAWHWAWERGGAPQLNARFEYQADRRMGPSDWAAWVSVRAVVQAVLRAQSISYDDMLAYLLGDGLNLDGAKASPLSVRSWDHQLRQPILLATNNYVVERAPLEGFVNPVNDLDTLGVTEAQSTCHF